jgi:hypothetical protein
MTSIWRRQPGQRIRSRNLVRKAATDASQLVAMGFFEATEEEPPPAGEAVTPIFASQYRRRAA